METAAQVLGLKQPVKFIGHVDAINESGVYGWAYDPDNPISHLQLLAYIDDIFITCVKCVLYRRDVEEASYARAEVGFHMQIPPRFCDGVTHILHFETEDKEPVSLLAGDTSQKSIFPFTLNYYFDYSFYSSFYSDVVDTGSREAYEHWVATGLQEGRQPNADKMFEQWEREGKILPADFSPSLYLLLNPDVAVHGASEWGAAAHFIRFGRAEGRPHHISKRGFITDVYFDGITPSKAQLEALLEAQDTNIYTSVEDLLSRNGVTSEAFIEKLNVSDYVTDNPEFDLRTKLQCVKHFVEHGLLACRAISFDLVFDHEFVAAFDASYAHITSEEAYVRWINLGVAASVPPNEAAFLSGLGLTDSVSYPAHFDPDVYVAFNPDLAQVLNTRWKVLKHVVESGLLEGRPGCPISNGTCDIYRAAADRLSINGQLKSAKLIYEQLLAEQPASILGNRHYADCLFRLEEFYQAARVYEQSVHDRTDNIWTHLNLTQCYISLNRWTDACNAIHRISELIPGDRFLQRRYREVIKRAHSHLMERATWLARQQFYARSLELARQASTLLSAPFAALPREPNVSSSSIAFVLIVADVGLPQCKFYRVDQKIEQLNRLGIRFKLISHHDDVVTAVREETEIDAAIFYRVDASPDIMWAIYLLRKARIPTFFEIDDLMFDESYFPESFESYCGQIDHDLYASLVLSTVAFATCMSVCDYAIASTSSLKSAMERHVLSGRAYVHPNSLSTAHERSYKRLDRRLADEKVRIFYGTGTRAHNEDFLIHLAPPLANLLRKWEDKLEVILMGYLPLPRVLLPFTSQITLIEPVWDVQVYWDILRQMDISIAVLKPGLISDCKSEIKWLEAAMLGVPSVVTATKTYDEVVESGVTGLLVHDDGEWFNHLDTLINNRDKRAQIGAKAREVVVRDYSLNSKASNLKKIFDSVTEYPAKRRRKILLVNVFFAPQSIGGATRVVIDNARDMLKNNRENIEIRVFCTFEGGKDAYLPLTYFHNGIRVTAISTPVDANIDLKIWDAQMATRFASVIDQFQPDLVHFHCVQRITLSVFQCLIEKSIPYLVTVHDGWWISDEQFLVDSFGKSQRYRSGDLLRELKIRGPARLERMKVKEEYLKSASRVLAVSSCFEGIYKEAGFSNVTTVSNGVSDIPILPRIPSEGRVRLAHIGGASLHKGYNLVRAALSRYEFPNVELLVIDHSMAAGEERHAIWNKTHVKFRAKFSQAEVGHLYRQVDILLAPSLWPESYGLVAREALLAGCRVIASNRGAIGDDITPENGWIIDVETLDGLSRVLSEVNDNPERYVIPPDPPKRLRTSKEQADELVAIYEEMVA